MLAPPPSNTLEGATPVTVRLTGVRPSHLEFDVSENTNVINTLAHTLTDIELNQAISMLVSERTRRQGAQLLEMKNQLSVGDKVEWFSSRGQQVKIGTVVKTKTKKAIVEEENMLMKWDIPMGMLKKV